MPAAPTLRLHLLAINARGDVAVQLDGQPHQLAAGDPAVVHQLTTSPGPHELVFSGRVPLGRTGDAAAVVEVPEQGDVDVYYALPAMPRMRGEVSDEPDAVPGREWRRVIFAVILLTVATWAVSLAWVVTLL
ncbi:MULTISPECIES: hypothetical protein [unclassified Luteococcus]|uniref:hypothetical protein n=1 Tax=unclassified Luteococcus TaxID=2639923 RepID=UPI00313CD258